MNTALEETQAKIQFSLSTCEEWWFGRTLFFIFYLFLLEWFIDDPNSTWLRCESASLGSIPLQNLLYIKYLQVKIFILSNLKKFTGGLAISPIESLFLNDMGLKFVSKKLYKTLCNLNVDNSDMVMGKWDSDLGTIEPEDWNALCGQPSSVLLSNSYWERQFKVLYKIFITPEARHRMNPTLSELCTKCKSAVG